MEPSTRRVQVVQGRAMGGLTPDTYSYSPSVSVIVCGV